MHSRYEIGLEQYVLSIGVEAKLTLEIGQHGRSCRRRCATRPSWRTNVGGAEGGRRRGRHVDARRGRRRSIADLRAGIAALRAALGRRTAATLAGGGRARRATTLLPAMAAVRAAADALEGVVADDLWPLPTYQEMLFIL